MTLTILVLVKRHNLEEINVMNEDGTMNELAGKYQGMDRYECRKQLMKDLEEDGYVIAVKDHSTRSWYLLQYVIL